MSEERRGEGERKSVVAGKEFRDCCSWADVSFLTAFTGEGYFTGEGCFTDLLLFWENVTVLLFFKAEGLFPAADAAGLTGN